MGEFWQLSFALYVKLVLMKSIYISLDSPTPHKIVLGEAVGGGHSQNKWLS
jgi:hypothetical protein